MLRACLLILAVLGLTGCAGQSYVALLEPGALTVEHDGERRLLEQAGSGLWLGTGGPPRPLASERLQREFAGALAARPRPPERFVVYLEDDSVPDLLAEQVLDRVLHAAQMRESPLVVVIGHTDSLGYKAVNVQVGLRRAQDIAERLKRRGMRAEVQVQSFGELDLLVSTPDATPEVRNRRVEIEVR